MDLQIIIKDETNRGIIVSILLTLMGLFFLIILKSVRDMVTLWLYKKFPRNKTKLYFMMTSQQGSYLEIISLFYLSKKLPILILTIFIFIYIIGNMFSGLIINTKNILTDLCTSNGCLLTGIGKNASFMDFNNNYSNQIIDTKILSFSSINNFLYEKLNNTITSGLPWGGILNRNIITVNMPEEIYQIPIERLNKEGIEYTGIYDTTIFSTQYIGIQYKNNTFLRLEIGNTYTSNESTVVNTTGWYLYDVEIDKGIKDINLSYKGLYLSTSTNSGINLILYNSLTEYFGDLNYRKEMLNYIIKNDTSIKLITYYGLFSYSSRIVIANVTMRSRNEGPINQIEFSTFDQGRTIGHANTDILFNKTENELNTNIKILSNFSVQIQNLLRNDINASASQIHNGDLISYILICFVRASSKVRETGTIKGYSSANIIIPVISINLKLFIPLLTITIIFLIPILIIKIKMSNKDNNYWTLYRLHTDAKNYIINLCNGDKLFKPYIKNNKEIIKMLNENKYDNDPLFQYINDEDFEYISLKDKSTLINIKNI